VPVPIRPVELEAGEGDATWDAILAAAAGDLATLRRLLDGNPRLARADYWYTPVIHFAARAGHIDALRLLLEHGADPEENGLNDRNLIGMARERGHEEIARLLEQARDRRGRAAAQPTDHPIHQASARGDVEAIGTALDADASLVNLGSRRGRTPLHYAVLGESHQAVNLLLDRGANIHIGDPLDLQAIDLALWGERGRSINLDIARLLISRGAAYDLAVASALGDLAGVRRMLDVTPSRISETRPGGRRPLSAAVQSGQDDIVRLLLERGANPRWEEPNAPHGTTVHLAASRGNLPILKLLLEHGADPHEDIDSTSRALAFAATPEVRELLESYDKGSDIWEATWVDDDAALRSVAADPAAHLHRIGAAITMNADRPDRLARLLDAGLRMPDVHTACQGYLINAGALRALLAHGMSPDQMNWQHQTLLHLACTKETSECAAILVDAGASTTARDDEYLSTPLAWAARTNRLEVVEFLLSRGAPVALPDDEPWATPLAWAERRGHMEIVATLRAHDATR
jgi:ankyrin repeat protein